MDQEIQILLGLVGARREYINTNQTPNMENVKQFDSIIKARLTKLAKSSTKQKA